MNRSAALALVALFAACGPDLPPGWEKAKRVDNFTQAECAGSPFEPFEVALAASKKDADTLAVTYDNAHYRCAQDLTAFWKDEADGASVLVQPIDMHPSMVAGCDCLYNVSMTLPLKDASGSVSVFRRWDDLNEPNDPVLLGDAAF